MVIVVIVTINNMFVYYITYKEYIKTHKDLILYDSRVNLRSQKALWFHSSTDRMLLLHGKYSGSTPLGIRSCSLMKKHCFDSAKKKV